MMDGASGHGFHYLSFGCRGVVDHVFLVCRPFLSMAAFLRSSDFIPRLKHLPRQGVFTQCTSLSSCDATPSTLFSTSMFGSHEASCRLLLRPYFFSNETGLTAPFGSFLPPLLTFPLYVVVFILRCPPSFLFFPLVAGAFIPPSRSRPSLISFPQR